MRPALNGFSSSPEDYPAIVTASPVLAAALSRRFAEGRLNAGFASWQRPAIYSVQAWLVACWQETRYGSGDVPALLSPSQERLLWERVIQTDTPGLFDVSAAAELAREAAQILAEFHVPLDHALWLDHQDGQQFQTWFRLFREECRRQGCITRSDLWDLVPGWLEAGRLPETPMLFLGFQGKSPAMARSLESLPEAQWLTTGTSDRVKRSKIAALARSEFKEEVESAARWARFSFEEGKLRSIAVFVPDLRSHLDLVERTFRDVFYPAWGTRLLRETAPPTDSKDSIFHITRSRSRLEHTVIAHAFNLLNLARPRIQHADAAAIIRSPFIKGATTERSERAFADLSLRRMRELDFSFRDLEWASRNCPALVPAWQAVKRVLKLQPIGRSCLRGADFLGTWCMRSAGRATWN